MRGALLLSFVLGLSDAWRPAWVAPMAAFRRQGGQASFRTRQICYYDHCGSRLPAMRDEMLAVADVHGWVKETRQPPHRRRRRCRRRRRRNPHHPQLHITTTTTSLSVSDAGFTALLKTSASDGDQIVAVQVDEQAQSSDSVEALTLLQLFQGALS